MSTIIVVKEADTLLLATDSRFMLPDLISIASDTEQKIFEIAPGTFIATSGRKMSCDFQSARARELANELGTTDIQTIGAALERESLPCLMELVELLRVQPDEITKQAVSGESLLHGCVLVGRTAGGQLGYVRHSYQVQAGGNIQCETELYFDAQRKISASSGSPAHLFVPFMIQFGQDVATWIDPPEHVVIRLLEGMKKSFLTVGGPDQVVRLDSDGSHWISQPPQAAVSLAGDLQTATIAAAVSMTSPSLTISGAGWTIALDTLNGFKIIKGTSTLQVIGTTSNLLQIFDSGGGPFVNLSSNGLLVADTTVAHKQANIGAGQLGCFNYSNSHQCSITEEGMLSLGSNFTYTGTLAAAIAAGKNVVNGVIVN